VTVESLTIRVTGHPALPSLPRSRFYLVPHSRAVGYRYIYRLGRIVRTAAHHHGSNLSLEALVAMRQVCALEGFICVGQLIQNKMCYRKYLLSTEERVLSANLGSEWTRHDDDTYTHPDH